MFYAMQRRLDWLATTGLEIMMTEYDIGWDNLIERADIYEDNIRAFFAHPALIGVLNWYLWDKVPTTQDPDHFLVTGGTDETDPNNLEVRSEIEILQMFFFSTTQD